jgi:hypothetical protein
MRASPSSRSPRSSAILALSSALLASLATTAPQAAHAFYGRQGTEARLTFVGEADVALAGALPSPADANQAKSAANRKVRAAVDLQVQHLMGTFQSESFLAEFPFPGVLGETYDLRFTSIGPGSTKGRARIKYKFSGTVAFKKAAFAKRNPREDVPIRLPLAPDLIYAQSFDAEKAENPCTDEHYNTEGDFWYFWDPEKEGCNLAGDVERVYRVRGRLEQYESTKTTYPEYDRLYGDDGRKERLDISVFIGYIDDLTNLKWPKRADDGRQAFEAVSQYLLKQGYRVTEHKSAFREDSLGRQIGQGINYYRVFESTVAGRGRELPVRIKLLLADTEISSRDSTFHRYWDQALENSDIVYYDGHSGLGGNLDLSRIPGTVKWKKDLYQIIFFNGCSSYPYFNGSYIKAKGGTDNLDLVISGLPTLTSSSIPNAEAFLANFVHGKRHSWQTIISDIDRSNGEDGTFLVGVVGDEDNQYRP